MGGGVPEAWCLPPRAVPSSLRHRAVHLAGSPSGVMAVFFLIAQWLSFHARSEGALAKPGPWHGDKAIYWKYSDVSSEPQAEEGLEIVSPFLEQLSLIARLLG